MSELPKCRTKHCRGRCFKSGKSPYCSKCRTRRFAAKYPISYHFAKLRNRAKERGKEFTLTLEQYTHFWNSSGYAERRGKTAESLSINRKDNSRGYHFDNIEAIPLTYNARFQYANIPEHIREEIRRAEGR